MKGKKRVEFYKEDFNYVIALHTSVPNVDLKLPFQIRG